jgi:hypothetical protein
MTVNNELSTIAIRHCIEGLTDPDKLYRDMERYGAEIELQALLDALTEAQTEIKKLNTEIDNMVNLTEHLLEGKL